MSTDDAQHYASYEDVVYPTYALPQTHPDRLATHARLFRMSPSRVERCPLESPALDELLPHHLVACHVAADRLAPARAGDD